MILITAFNGKTNSSKLLIDGICNSDVHKLMLTNSFASCGKQMADTIFGLKPDCILSFGQKPDADCLFIETTARHDAAIIRTDYDIDGLTNSLTAAEISYRLSVNAGNYLCNHAYFAGLNVIQHNDLTAKMVFIHVPSIKRFFDIKKVSAWLTEYLEGLL